jgi:hypothetical protein
MLPRSSADVVSYGRKPPRRSSTPSQNILREFLADHTRSATGTPRWLRLAGRFGYESTPSRLLSGVGAYLSVRFPVRYFRESRSLTPFGIYRRVVGLGSVLYLTLR